MYKKILMLTLSHKRYQLLKLLLSALLLMAFKSSIDANPPFQAMDCTPQKIALLLPLQGEYKTISHAIQVGFLKANESINIPLSIKTIDTSEDKTLKKSYACAKKWGADLMIGPLLKSDIQSLAQLKALSLPVLTLNYLTKKEYAPANFYQFGLSPLDEAKALADHAKEKQHQSALILVPNNQWGEALAQSFKSHWEHCGGKVVDTLKYSSHISILNHQIKKLLAFKPPNQRRDDFDVIFLGANPDIARQIKPLLAFYFASNIPIYANAGIYDAKASSHLNRDLDGTIIADTPWSIGVKNIHSKSRLQCIAVSQKQFDYYARYYALGVDALLLTLNLVPLDQDTHKTIQGASGALHLDQDRYVIRKPLCAQLKNSKPQPL